MSIATLLSQHHQVTAVDIIPEKVDMINNRKSPIQDDYLLCLHQKRCSARRCSDLQDKFWSDADDQRQSQDVE